MAQKNAQFIAVVAQGAEAAETLDIQQLLEKNLMQKYDFQRQRFQTAFLYSSVATAGVIIALLVIFALNLLNIKQMPDTYHLFGGFFEWRTEGASQFPICSAGCEILTQSTRLLAAALDIGKSIIAGDGQGNIAGIARLCTLVSVTFAVGFAYRKRLSDYYTLNAHQAQLEDFENTPRWQYWLSRLLYILATLFGTYVVVSIIWFGLSFVFKNMTLGWFNAAIIVVIFTGGMTFAAVYGALAVSTRDALLLGLLTFVVGFSVSFALAPPTDKGEWWQVAVSNAGQLNPSASLFTGTLLSGSLALLVVWFDLDSIIQKMIDDGDLRLLNARAWMRVAQILYALLILGLLFVGFIRVDEVNQPFNMVFHAGGAVFAIASVVISGLLIRKRRFHPWYKIFSVHILLGATVAMSIIGSFKVDPPSWVFPGTGLISLTVIELSLFLMIGLWVYVTVDNLLAQADINAFGGQVLVMARKDNPV